MKRILGWIGIAVFWICWPVWFVYFKRHPKRSRVVVICGDEVLLVRGFLASSARWSLPGGGRDAGESAAAAAVRELSEELGIMAAETALRHIGATTAGGAGLKYQADYFVLELNEKPALHLRTVEILRAKWYVLSKVRGRMLEQDAAYGLKQYEPLSQESLL